MELTQLAFVLDYMDTSIHDTELLPAYAQLMSAVELVSAENPESIAAVQAARELVVGLHDAIRPKNWMPEQIAILEKYEALELIGEPVIVRIQNAFIENFLEPKALHAELSLLHDETLALAERVTLLLKGLDPVLTSPPAVTTSVEGEVVEAGDGFRPMSQPEGRGALALIKERLPLRNRSNAIIRADDVPLSTKLLAAAPVVIAAAGKALEVYKTYSDAKLAASQTALAKPTAQQAQPVRNTTQQGTNYVRYSYSRSVYITTRDDYSK